MGFGIALLGYCFLVINYAGATAIGGFLIGYGLFKASRLEGKFLYASVAALAMIPRGIFGFLSDFRIIELPEGGFGVINIINFSTYILYITAFVCMNYFWLTGVKKIANDNGAKKLFGQAHWRLVLSLTFSVLSYAVIALQMAGMLPGVVASVYALIEMAVVIVNAFFMHTCFILITSESQYEKDKQELAKHNADVLLKQQSDKKKEEEYAKKRASRRK